MLCLRFKRISRKLTDVKFVLMVMFKPQSLKQVLKPKIESYGCNCRDRDSCPMENQCLTSQIVYRADVSNNKDNETKFYYGLTETSFKKGYGNHKRSFIHELRSILY